MSSLVHSSYYRPKGVPYKADTDISDIDRLQDMSFSTSLNRTKIEEIGRDGIVGWRNSIPTVSGDLTQLEYGTIDFWNLLANKVSTNESILLTDFKNSRTDIIGYKTDDNGDFLGTVWYPKLRMNSFSLNIGDPDALIERSVSLNGEDENIFINDNKYLIFFKDDSASGASHTIEIGVSGSSFADYPTPVGDPDNSGQYMLKVLRVRGTADKELTYVSSSPSTDQYTYDNSTQTITLGSDSANGDIYKVWYTATTDPNNVTAWTENDTDESGIDADSCSIYLGSANYVYRLQSVGIEVSFDRTDYKEIGNKDIVAYGTKDITTKITLGRILETHTVEEILRGKAGASYGRLDVREFADDLTLIVKVYSDSKKGTFLLGYKFKDLTTTGLDASIPTSDYIERGVSIEGEEAIISDNETTLDNWS